MKHTVRELTLESGAKGLLVDIPDAPVMGFLFSFRAGDVYTPSGKYETAHLMEHLILGANKKHPTARAFAAEVEKNGAYFNASTSKYDITYDFECADFEWDRILDLACSSIESPLFLGDEFESEKSNVREELIGRSNNHFRALSLATSQAFGLGDKTDEQRLVMLEGIVNQDIKKFYKETHTARNMRFVLAGNITPDREAKINERLESMTLAQGTRRRAMPNVKLRPLETPLVVQNETVPNVHFYIETFRTPGQSVAERRHVSVTSSMLADTYNSRIFGKARDQGLAYGVSIGQSTYKNASNWWVGTQVSQDNVVALFRLIASELNDVRKGRFTDEEVASAVRYTLGRYARGGQTVQAVLNRYAGAFLLDEPIESDTECIAAIESITKKDMQTSFNAQLTGAISGIGLLGTVPEGVAEQLQPFVEQISDKLQ